MIDNCDVATVTRKLLFYQQPTMIGQFAVSRSYTRSVEMRHNTLNAVGGSWRIPKALLPSQSSSFHYDKDDANKRQGMQTLSVFVKIQYSWLSVLMLKEQEPPVDMGELTFMTK